MIHMKYPRKIFPQLCRFLDDEEFFLLQGARQVGKTTLLRMLQTYLEDRGDQTFFFDMENMQYLEEFNENPENLFAYIPESQKKLYIFVDEIQYLERPSHFLKYLYDHYREKIKIIATGSASLEIKSKIQDSLVGRYFAFRIQPLCLEEFLQFKEADSLQWNLKKLTSLQKKNLKKLLKEFLLFGGMPAVVLKKTVEEKKKLLFSYVHTYLQKDIRSIVTISDIVKYNFLLKMTSQQVGNLLNINKMAESVEASFPTTKRYLEILEHTHVIARVPPYIKNIRKQIHKMHKLYFYDMGVRNAVINSFEDIDTRSDAGALFENMVYLELLQKNGELYFYRSKSDAEIDFLLEREDLLLLEVKYASLKKIVPPKIFHSFGETSKKQRKYIINLSLQEKITSAKLFLSFYFRKYRRMRIIFILFQFFDTLFVTSFHLCFSSLRVSTVPEPPRRRRFCMIRFGSGGSIRF